MKEALLLTLSMTLAAGAQMTSGNLTMDLNGQANQNRDAQYIVIYGHSVVDPTRSYAVYCPDVHPSCNTVYRMQIEYAGFADIGGALEFLQGNQDFSLIRLVKTTDIPVKVLEKKKTEHHPDTETAEKVYSK